VLHTQFTMSNIASLARAAATSLIAPEAEARMSQARDGRDPRMRSDRATHVARRRALRTAVKSAAPLPLDYALVRTCLDTEDRAGDQPCSA
jgi:hypothetical protein